MVVRTTTYRRFCVADALACVAALLAALSIGPQAARADDAADLYAFASQLYARGEWRLAAGEFTSYLENFSAHGAEHTAECHFFLGECLLRQAQYAPARRHFETYGHSGDQAYRTQAAFRVAESLFLEGKDAEAAEALAAFRQRYSGDPLAAYVMEYQAEIALAAEQWGEAAECFGQALAAYPDDPRAASWRKKQAECLQAAQKFDRAAKAWADVERSGGDDPAAEQEAALAQARSLEAADQADESLRHYDRVRLTWPRTVAAAHAAAAAMRLTLRRGEWAEAKRRAAEAERRHEFQAEPTLAEEIVRDISREAIRRGEQALAIERLRPWVAAEGDPAAEATDNEDTTANPAAAAENRFLLGLAHLGAGDVPTAAATFAPLRIDALPADQQALAESAWANALLLSEDYAAAATRFRRAIAAYPDAEQARPDTWGLAVALAADGDMKAAQKIVARQAPSLTSDDSRGTATVAFLADRLLAQGRAGDARPLYGRLAEKDMPPATIAAALEGMARCDQALAAANHPKEIAASTKPAAEASPAKPIDESIEAVRQSDQAERLAPRAMMARARSLAAQEKPEAALAAYREVFTAYPAAPAAAIAMLAAADLAEQIGQSRQATKTLAEFVRAFPRHERMDEALYRWAWLELEGDEPGRAAGLLRRLHEEFGQSVYWADASYRLAELHAGDKDAVAAHEIIDEILTRGPDDPLTADARFLKARLLANAGDWAAAEPLLAKVAKASPAPPVVYAARLWLAEAAFRSRNYRAAAEQFDWLAERKETSAVAYRPLIALRRAQILAHGGDWTAAAAAAEGLKQDFPDYDRLFEADYLLGRAAATKGDFAAAREAYLGVIRSQEGGQSETAAMAQWMIGETFFHQRNHLEAIRAYSRVELLYPYPHWQAAALLQMAKCYEHRGETAQAFLAYEGLATQFGQTRFAQAARWRLQELGKTSDIRQLQHK